MRIRSTLVAAVAILIVASALTACGGAPQLAPDEIAAAFIAKTNDPARTYHSDLRGTYSNGQLAMPGQNMTSSLTAAFDYQGTNYAGTITTQMGGGIGGGMASTVSYIRIGEVSWVRYDASTPWQRMPANQGAGPPGMDALTGLTVADVAYESAETIDDQPLHRIRVIDPAAAFARAFDTGGGLGLEVAEGSEYLVYVDGQGVPVAAQSHLVGSTSFGEDLPPVDGPPMPMPEMSFAFDFTYNYSAWGSDITILQPPS